MSYGIKRPDLNLAQSFKGGNKLLVYRFTESSKRRKVITDIVQAFTQGYNCFQFLFEAQGRKFRECVAIPHSAGFDEVDAARMAADNFDKFSRTVQGLISKTL